MHTYLAISSTARSPNHRRRRAVKGNDVEFSIHCECHGTGRPYCDGNTRNIKKKKPICKIGRNATPTTCVKKETEKGNPSAFNLCHLVVAYLRRIVSGLPRKRRRSYCVKHPTEFQSTSSLKFESTISKKRIYIVRI